jgi:hypothetical protein
VEKEGEFGILVDALLDFCAKFQQIKCAHGVLILHLSNVFANQLLVFQKGELPPLALTKSRSGSSRSLNTFAYRNTRDHLLRVLKSTLPRSALQRIIAANGSTMSAKTVGGLRKVSAWPDNLVMTTPQERYAGSVIKVSKTSVATRVTPKP